jgi:O-antigen/teichoic acid export membrane protein
LLQIKAVPYCISNNMYSQFIVISLTRVLSFINTYFANRILSLENLGVSSLLQVSAQNIAVLSDFGLNEVSTREYRNSHIFEILGSILIFRLGLSIILCFLVSIAWLYIENRYFTWATLAILFVCVIKNGSDMLYVYRTLNNLLEFYLINLAAPVIVGFFYYFSLKDLAYVPGVELLILTSVSSVLNGIMLLRMRGKIKLNFNYSITKNYIISSWKLSLSAIINVFVSSGLIYYCAIILDIGALGLVRTTLLLIVPFEILLYVVNNFFMRDFFSCRSAGERLVFYHKYLMRMFPILFFSIIIVLSINENILAVVLGYDYKLSIFYFKIIAMSKIFLLSFLPFTQILYTDNKNNMPLFSSTLVVFVSMPGFLYSIENYSLIGLAITQASVDVAFMLPGVYYFFWKESK